ncbi:phage tail tape measure protein [Chromobacterium violaceum]|uniref:phage tail tape measure protein n=1 Tax=Chromobacterium violaceum TaxID=536 RepID=UPI0005BDA76F|nr:phage tail tape measure protein [Chromobacterium violaceum]
MADNAELGFSVDTSQLDEATKALDRVTDAAGRTEQATISAGGAGRKMAHDYVPGVDATVEAIQRSERAANAYIQSLQKQLDMLGKNKAEQAALQAQYSGFSQQIQQQAYDIGKKIDAWHREEEAAKAAAKAEELAGRTAVASAEGFKALTFANAGSTRELIVLAHEAMTGNFSRMPGSFMVLMERAGGLHEMLGALVSPFGLLATAGVAAVGAIAVAFYQGTQETKAFNNAIALTGNYVGMTSSSFETMAQRLADANHVSAGSMRELMDQMIQTGQVGGKQIELITDAAQRYAKLTGGDAADAATKFAKALGDPSKSAVELNNQMHFLTLAQYEHIAALQKSGDVQGAQLALSKALDDHLKNVSGPNLGYIAMAWEGVAMSVRKAWDAMKGWGREESKAEEIAANNAEIASLMAAPTGSGYGAGNKARADALRARNAQLQAELAKETSAAQMKAQVDQIDQEGIAARARYDRFLAEFASPAEKRQKEIAERMRDFDAMIMAGGQVTPKMRDDAIAAINEKYKDKKPPRAKIDHAARQTDQEMARAQAMLAEARAQIGMLADGDDSRLAKLTAAEKRITELRAQLNMPQQFRLSQMSDGQIKNAIAEYQKVIPLQRKFMEDRLAAHNQELANKSALDTGNKWRGATAQQLAQLQQERDLVGASMQARKLYAAQLKIEQDLRSAISAAANKVNLTDQEFIAQYPQVVEQLRQGAKVRMEQEIPAIQQEIELQQRWSTGWTDAWASYQDAANNNARAASAVFNSMTHSMESALAQFFETGKLGWKSFAAAILQEIEKIMVAKAAAGLLTQAVGFISGMVPTQAAAPVEVGTPTWTAQADGGAWSRGVQFFANGGVFDRPTGFAHAGGLGVLGEAGPEAVMPLTRGSDGRLGVRASGGSGGGDVVINQTVIYQDAGGKQTQGDAAGSTMMAGMAEAMKGLVKQGIAAELRQGGMLYNARNA